ncbi:TetR/AcrR family transcriptional regulator [Cellulosimicrobium arenosum]|uniref:TetR/AcrR family transcriptional regulator n=1 Tax=Cellulosimicrobium arenosum TaxID=2708133 RepID=A0A927PGN9_9MICO|nr:TetR/AcrR family transcriptional regulator [Cellulosimicrobium arenosum]MBD8080315.1 TetR/AcrR family transcriptional regulator [Cellulosimicrobium arenosum]
MPRVSEEYRAARRREIADAALRAVRRKGFQAASMADIIAESGMSAGAIYGYYAGKGEIVHEVATRIVGGRLEDVERLAAADPMPPPADVVRVLASGMLEELGETGVLVQMWGEAVTDPTLQGLASAVLSQLRDAYVRYLSAWHQREHGLAPEDADALGADQAPLFLAASQAFVVQSALLDDFDAEAYLDRVTRHLPR